MGSLAKRGRTMLSRATKGSSWATLLIELGMKAYRARSYPGCFRRPLTPTQLRVIGRPLFSDSDQFRSATKRRNGPEADFKPRFSTLAIKFVDYILSLGARCITLVWTMSSHSCASKGTGTSIQSRAFKPRVWRVGSTSHFATAGASLAKSARVPR